MLIDPWFVALNVENLQLKGILNKKGREKSLP